MLITMGVIFCLSHQQGQSLTFPELENLDKLFHIVFYGILGLTTHWVSPAQWHRSKPILVVLVVVTVGLFYGVFDEYHQSFVPGRDSSVGDICADVTGSILACLAWLWNKKDQFDSYR